MASFATHERASSARTRHHPCRGFPLQEEPSPFGDRLRSRCAARPTGTRQCQHLGDIRDRSEPRCRSGRSEEHTSELQSLMRLSYAVFCLQKKTQTLTTYNYTEAT